MNDDERRAARQLFADIAERVGNGFRFGRGSRITRDLSPSVPHGVVRYVVLVPPARHVIDLAVVDLADLEGNRMRDFFIDAIARRLRQHHAN